MGSGTNCLGQDYPPAVSDVASDGYCLLPDSIDINILMESGTNHLGQDCLSAVSDVATNLLSQWSYGYHLLPDSVDVLFFLSSRKIYILMESGTNCLGRDCLYAVSDVASNLLSQWIYMCYPLPDSVDGCCMAVEHHVPSSKEKLV
ncbi:hypothetical protein RRG08_020540 [Elysia crispata]|uniref:Uncharacterized protein n=1 Tax=Elysia crispata TaxID=231223 RepID=A0AAE1DAV0_9GAST|nr:hypothetical protein RRG08_020540 [Elysia crispata]